MKISVHSFIASVLLACVAAAGLAWPSAAGDARKLPDASVLSQSGPTFTVADSQLPQKLSIIVYGDMRFTDPSNTKVANPRARQLLVDKVASEHPDALELTGDIAYAGKNPADYDEFKAETASWRAANLRVYPALGNHELVGGPDSLKNWWAAFPELNNRRWYSVELGKRVYLINLDSNSDLMEDSPQMLWLQDQITHLPKPVEFVFILLHHPPVADKQTLTEVDHNPRPNEIAVRDYLSKTAPQSRAQFIVASGHIHNYERLSLDGVTYLVSGGGGAHPYQVERGPADEYQTTDAINFHYILFHLDNKQLEGTMYRLADPAAQTPEWRERDRFVIAARR
jgi:hypothetical protein